MSSAQDGPGFQFNDDGSIADCAAFRAALRADPEKLTLVQGDPAAAAILLEGDDEALQAFMRNTFQAEVQRIKKFQAHMAERTIDAQRASATVPRDTVQLYKQLAEAGLQYGPAFRLLRNVHVPDQAGMVAN